MPIYRYTARKVSGEIVKAKIKAANESSVREYLESKGLIVIDVSKEKKRKRLFSRLPLIGEGVSNKELLIFTKYFSILAKAGIPVLKALKILEDQTSNPYFKSVIHGIYTKVTGGSSLFLAFDNYPDVFPQSYRNLLRIGEESGALHEILVRLHTQLQKSARLRGKVIGAMMYPAAIALVAIGVVTFLLVKIIPQFVEIFEQNGAQLPRLTRAVVWASYTLLYKWYLVIGGIAAAVFLISFIYKTPRGKMFLHKLVLKPPVLGPLMTKYNVAQFAQNLDMLTRGGASVTEALKMATESISNVAIKAQLASVVPDVEAGQTIAKALEKVELVPVLVLQMIAVGEETGSLNEMLETVAEFYEEEIDASVATLLSLIEPAFILVLGAIVGTIVVAMYLPIFQMARTVSGAGH